MAPVLADISPLAEHLRDGIHDARTPDQLDGLIREVWRCAGLGRITDDEAQMLAEVGAARRPRRDLSPRPAVRRQLRQVGLSGIPPGAPPPRSSDRAASRARRRKWGGAGRMPPQIRCLYTEGERAVLSVLADWIVRNGVSVLPLAAIAARAGVCRTTVQNALRRARRLGHLRVVERPQRGRKSLTNIIRIISGAWMTWLRLAGSASGGAGAGDHGESGFKTAKALSATEKRVKKRRRRRAEEEAAVPPDSDKEAVADGGEIGH